MMGATKVNAGSMGRGGVDSMGWDFSMTKHLTIFLFGATVFGPAAFGQFGMNIAASIGSAAGKRISDQVANSLRQGTQGFNTGGSAGKGKQGAGKGAPGTPAANVPAAPTAPPPPPPLQRVVASTRKTTAPSWMTGRTPLGPPLPPEPPVNVDLGQIERGMARESLLALGKPTSKITLYEDGHMVEIYQYRNQTVASGTVRLRDGAVASVEARP